LATTELIQTDNNISQHIKTTFTIYDSNTRNTAINVGTYTQGIGQALFIIDYGIQQNTIWVVCLKETGKILHFDSNQLTMTKNNTLELNELEHKP
jgi:hypothetical protein